LLTRPAIRSAPRDSTSRQRASQRRCASAWPIAASCASRRVTAPVGAASACTSARYRWYSDSCRSSWARRGSAEALDGQHAHDDLVAQRRWICGTPAEPRAERALATQRETKHAAQARAVRDVAPRDVAASFELVQHLVDLADVRMPERPDALGEALSQRVAVRFPLAEQRHQRVSKMHRGSSPKAARCEDHASRAASAHDRVADRRSATFTHRREIALTPRWCVW
jgi:hypothetical protein